MFESVRGSTPFALRSLDRCISGDSQTAPRGQQNQGTRLRRLRRLAAYHGGVRAHGVVLIHHVVVARFATASCTTQHAHTPVFGKPPSKKQCLESHKRRELMFRFTDASGDRLTPLNADICECIKP